MGLVAWIALFGGTTALCGWIVVGDGAETLAGQFLAMITGADYDWQASIIRLWFAIGWIAATIWFVLGLFDPEMRI